MDVWMGGLEADIEEAEKDGMEIVSYVNACVDGMCFAVMIPVFCEVGLVRYMLALLVTIAVWIWSSVSSCRKSPSFSLSVPHPFVYISSSYDEKHAHLPTQNGYADAYNLTILIHGSITSFCSARSLVVS